MKPKVVKTGAYKGYPMPKCVRCKSRNVEWQSKDKRLKGGWFVCLDCQEKFDPYLLQSVFGLFKY